MISTTKLNKSCVLQLREEKKKTGQDGFEAVILEAVDEIFSSFGDSSKKAIYFQLEKTFKIKKTQIPLKIEDFAHAIEQIFGAGAKFIELRIIETLHRKTPNFVYFPKMDDELFTEYVTGLHRFHSHERQEQLAEKTSFTPTLTKQPLFSLTLFQSLSMI
jgi:hypothetical protein